MRLGKEKVTMAHFDKGHIEKIVNSIEKGLPRSKAVKKYGMARCTLSDWMREYGSPAYHAVNKKLSISD